MALEIATIADHLPTVARWHFDEWGDLDPKGSLASWTAGLRERTYRDRIPTTFVALYDSIPVGSLVLVDHDMDTRRDLTPWLAGLFVVPSHRGRGMGSALVRHAIAKAQEFGVAMLYLYYTRDAEALYRHLGWSPLAREFYKGRWVTIMSVRLSR